MSPLSLLITLLSHLARGTPTTATTTTATATTTHEFDMGLDDDMNDQQAEMNKVFDQPNLSFGALVGARGADLDSSLGVIVGVLGRWPAAAKRRESRRIA